MLRYTEIARHSSTLVSQLNAFKRRVGAFSLYKLRDAGSALVFDTVRKFGVRFGENFRFSRGCVSPGGLVGGSRDEAKTRFRFVNAGRHGLTLSLDHVEGTRDHGEQGFYILSCRCNVCGNRVVKRFSKKAYDEGVVIVKCDGCGNQHLVSDKLGWFGDNEDGDTTGRFKD